MADSKIQHLSSKKRLFDSFGREIFQLDNSDFDSFGRSGSGEASVSTLSPGQKRMLAERALDLAEALRWTIAITDASQPLMKY